MNFLAWLGYCLLSLLAMGLLYLLLVGLAHLKQTNEEINEGKQ